MANLLGQNIGTNYKGILNLGSTINTPVSGTLQAITDGDGLASALNVSTTSVAVSGTLGVTAGANLAIASGDVGIGTSSPTTKLTVNGVIRLFDGSLTGTGGVELSSEAGFGFAAQSVAYKFRNQNNNATYVILDSDGLKFNGDTAAANALDDYEEGTFTPTIVGSTTAGTASYTEQVGRYTKIGRLVQFEIYLVYSSGTGTGDLRITGLPFTIGGLSYPSFTIASCDNITMTADNIAMAWGFSGTSTIVLQQMPTGGGVQAGIAYDAAGGIQIAGTYSV